MTVLRVRGTAVATGATVDLYADGDRWTTDPVRDAEPVPTGWLLPGLVDAHTHPGYTRRGGPLQDETLREHLHQHLHSGVTLIRAPGLAGDPPDWFGTDPDLPRAVHAGPWIARHGQFFDGWGRRATDAELPGLAAAQAARTGWAKLIADWTTDAEHIPVEVLRAVVERVHAVGGRVAVHSQQRSGGTAAVHAGVDSLEHGTWLDPDLLTLMAAQGTALTPTLSVLLGGVPVVTARPPGEFRDWYLAGVAAHPAMIAAAAEAGVTLLAGTDSLPHGRIADEVRALAGAGVPPHQALGAASWTARSYLGLPGLEPGAPADAVVYATDPRTDLHQLDHPLAVILRGRRVR